MELKKSQDLIRYASTISFCWAAIYLLILLAIFIPMAAQSKLIEALPFLIVMAFFTCVMGVMGWGLRKFYKWAGIMSVIVAGFFTLIGLLMVLANPPAIFNVILGGSILTLVVIGWPALAKDSNEATKENA